MSKLKLSAKVAGHNKRHVRITVFQNHANTGTLIVDREHVAEVLGIINYGAEMAALIKDMSRYDGGPDIGNLSEMLVDCDQLIDKYEAEVTP